MAQPKERTCYRVEYGGSTHYAYVPATQVEFDSVLVEEAGTATEDVLSWAVS